MYQQQGIAPVFVVGHGGGVAQGRAAVTGTMEAGREAMADAGGSGSRKDGGVDLLCVDEVAAMLRCGPRSVRRWVAPGRMSRPPKVGRLARWRRWDVERILVPAGQGPGLERHAARPRLLRDRYAQLMGIRELRRHLRRSRRGTVRRQRCLLVTASLRLRDGGEDLIEFDGAIVSITSRSGRTTWYGLESKRGAGDPLASLDRRPNRLGIPARTHKLSSRCAFAELMLKQLQSR